MGSASLHRPSTPAVKKFTVDLLTCLRRRINRAAVTRAQNPSSHCQYIVISIHYILSYIHQYYYPILIDGL